MTQQNTLPRRPMPELYHQIVAQRPELASNTDMIRGLVIADQFSRVFAGVGNFFRGLVPEALAHR